MLDHLPIDLAHAIAARLDPDTRASAWLAAPRLLPPPSATLEVPAEATAARSAAAAWLRSPAASVRGLETRAVLRLHPVVHPSRATTDREAVRAALEALKASGRRVSALELVSAASSAAAAAGATTTAIVDAQAFFEDARELLGGSLRELVVRDVELRVVAEQETETAAAATAPQPPPLLLDSLELDGAVTPENLRGLVEAAIRPCVRATARLAVRLRQQQQKPTAPCARAVAEQIARACAAVSRDALGRPHLREVEVLGLPFKGAAGLEQVRRCIVEEVGLARLRLGLGSAGAVAATGAANATTTTTTASILEAEWRRDGSISNPALASLTVHARVADSNAFAEALAAAAAPLGGASAPCLLAAVESLTLLLAPAALDEEDDRLARLLSGMPHLKRLRLAVMAKSTFPGGSGPLLKRALAAVATADPPSLASFELCAGLAAVQASSAAEVLAPLMIATESSNLRRSLKALKVAAAFMVERGVSASVSPPPPAGLATALPSLRWLALNNLMVGCSGEAMAASLPSLHVADLPAELERLDLRGWALAEPPADSARPLPPPPAPALLARLSLRECAFSPAAAARLGPNVTEVVLCGSSNAFWRRSEREADRLARAWPRLRSLALGGNDAAPALPALVAAAARRCPSLRELRLQGLAELDARALAQALRPAARTLRVLDVAAAANVGSGGEEDEAPAPAAAAPAASPPPPPDAAGVARAVAPLEALRRLRVKAPGWRFDGAGAALAAAIARPWMAVEAVCGPPPRVGALPAAALPAST